MGNLATLKDEYGAHTKPKKETVKFILEYSKSLEIKKLKSGIEIYFIKN